MPEAAVAIGDDPRSYARLMSSVHEATMSGGRTPARPRDVIGESWRRLMSMGIDPDGVTAPTVDRSDLDALRRASGLLPIIDDVSRGLESIIADGASILVVADAAGRVLWRSGSPSVLSAADRLGFIEGASWAERDAGTNAIGTALASNRAVQVFSAEHFLRTHHSWTCAGAPIVDPRTGQVIGVIDVSGPAGTVHPMTLALVDAVGRLAESHLREQHSQALNQLRMVAAPIMARIACPAMAVDCDGWVAAVDLLPVRRRIVLPPDMGAGRTWIPALGSCDVDMLPGGWLIRPVADGDAQAPMRVLLDFSAPATPAVELIGQFGSWRREVSLRHAEILLILARTPAGRSAPELAADLYGERSRVVTVRAELSRLRKHFAGLLAAQPYRFSPGIEVEVRYPSTLALVLPASTAPAICAARSSRDLSGGEGK